MDRINVRVDEQLKQQLEAEARARGIRPSEVVREVLAEHLKARTPPPSCLDIAQRIGLIASVRGLPADLSTNPEHMEGFGRG
jgi:hypothetical protein